jgi:hypothetical protein
MFGELRRTWRWRTASVLVVVYALCLATPTLVIALSHSSIPVHCLNADEHGVATTLSHEHGSPQQHHPDGDHDDQVNPGKCCGLFSTSAIAPAIAIVDFQTAVLSPSPSFITANLTGRGPDRIDRPPRSHLSL